MIFPTAIRCTPKVHTLRLTSEHTRERNLMNVLGMAVVGNLPDPMNLHGITENILDLSLLSVICVQGHFPEVIICHCI